MVPKLNDYYSGSYVQARDRFLKATSGFQRKPEYSVGVESDVGSLTVNAAFNPAEKTRHDGSKDLVIISSGTHGIEGFAGSAVQLYFIQELLSRFNEYTSVALIHALNPYGFHHRRRVASSNVDLNRNCLDNLVDYKVDDEELVMASDASQLIVAPNRPRQNDFEEQMRFARWVLQIIAKRRFKLLENAIGGGQYKHPESLFYGGTEPEQSVKILQSIIEEYTSGHRNFILIDLHTGYGRKLRDNHITDSPISSEEFKRLQGIIPEIESNAQVEAQSGVYKHKGSVMGYAANHSQAEHNYRLVVDFRPMVLGKLEQLLNRYPLAAEKIEKLIVAY